MSFQQYVQRLEKKGVLDLNASPSNLDLDFKQLASNDSEENPTARKMPNSIQTYRHVGADYGASRLESNIGVTYSPGFYRNFENRLTRDLKQPDPSSNLGFIYRDQSGPIILEKRPDSKQKLLYNRNKSVNNSSSLPQIYKPRANLQEIRSSLYQQPPSIYNPQGSPFYNPQLSIRFNPQPATFSNPQIRSGPYLSQYSIPISYSPSPTQFQNINFMARGGVSQRNNPNLNRRSGSLEAEVKKKDELDRMLFERNLAKREHLLSSIALDISGKREKKHMKIEYLEEKLQKVKRESMEIDAYYNPLFKNDNLRFRYQNVKADRR